MQIKLGDQMKELRLRDGRTQEELARALGVTAQAVSRWEKGVCYPDMEIIPSIANYFGVSIDELFGYHGERTKKIEALSERIKELNRQNNGVDICVDECIRLAREGLVEFPGNERLMLCLASVLYNAGYVRKGEYHLTDDEGYDVYDTARHRDYPEWQEAITLYEKLLDTLDAGEMRHQAVRELIQLYVNTGEYKKAATIAESAPELSECREMLRINTCDGRKRAEAYGEALIRIAKACSHLMVSCVMVNDTHIKPEYASEAVKNAIKVFDLIFTDGNYGFYHEDISQLNLYLSSHLWRTGDKDGAFSALYEALEHAKKLENLCEQGEAVYTAPLISTVKQTMRKTPGAQIAKGLPEDWPWWAVPDCSSVAAEMKSDPRWSEWVKKCTE